MRGWAIDGGWRARNGRFALAAATPREFVGVAAGHVRRGDGGTTRLRQLAKRSSAPCPRCEAWVDAQRLLDNRAHVEQRLQRGVKDPGRRFCICAAIGARNASDLPSLRESPGFLEPHLGPTARSTRRQDPTRAVVVLPQPVTRHDGPATLHTPPLEDRRHRV